MSASVLHCGSHEASVNKSFVLDIVQHAFDHFLHFKVDAKPCLTLLNHVHDPQPSET